MNKKILEATRQEISSCLKDNGIAKIVKKRQENIFQDYDEDTGQIDFYNKYTLKEANNDCLGLEFRLYRANMRRRENIKRRIEEMLETNNCYFLTLTFNDRFLSRDITTETRRRYISRFLKEQCKCYVANIDFGSEKHREHYHAVVVPKSVKIDFGKYRNKFDASNINCVKVWNNAKSKDTYTMYINKLTNHSLKDNGFYKRLIYSRHT